MNEEIIKRLGDWTTCRTTFNCLTEEEKEKYFMYCDSLYTISQYLYNKDDEFIINALRKNDLTQIKNCSLFEVIDNLKDNNLLCEVIINLPLSAVEYYKFKNVFKKIESDADKVFILNRIITKLKNSNIIKKLVNCLESDETKTLYFLHLTNQDQVSIIKNFTDLELKKKYVLKPQYSDYRSELVASVEDEDFILQVFDQITVKKFRHNLIRRIDDLGLKEKLIYKLGNKSLIDFIHSFNEEQKNIEVDENIDSNISIGVELETCHKDIEVLKVLKEMPHGFKIIRDGSVKSGFEIVSPILHHTQEDMNSLNDICKILKDNSFYTDSSCGGHIHLGADYLESIDEYKMFLHLYCNFEDIIYLICNKVNSKSRPSINRYASKTKLQYLNALKDGLFDGDYESLEEFKEKLIEINDSRYKGLNVYNLKSWGKNTIEFRMANGEIDYNELYHNIKLYARLLQVSKELANIKQEDPRKVYLNLLSTKLSEKERLTILLSLLFKDEKDREFYKKRYEKNINIINNILNAFKKTEAIEIVNPKTLVLNK